MFLWFIKSNIYIGLLISVHRFITSMFMVRYLLGCQCMTIYIGLFQLREMEGVVL